MKAIIVSVICRLIAYISVLAFVFGIVALTGKYVFLMLLFLLMTCDTIPVYQSKGAKDDRTDWKD